jgi:alkylation response protein AidB-like acyl-CoA dehydrogenase
VNFAFSDEQEEFRETLRRFLAAHAPMAEVRRAIETPEGFDAALWKHMAQELGLQGIHLPEAYGGQGFSFLELGIVQEELGRWPGSSARGAGTSPACLWCVVPTAEASCSTG